MEADGIDLSELERTISVERLTTLQCGPLRIVMTSDPLDLNQDIQDIHTSYEFLLPLTHIPRFQIEKKLFELKAGQLVVIVPGQRHGLGNPVKMASFIIMMYQSSYLEELFTKIYQTDDRRFRNDHRIVPADVQMILVNLIQEHQERRPGCDLLISHLSEYLAILLIRHYGQTHSNRHAGPPRTLKESQLRFRPVIEYMNNHLNEKINIDQLAEMTQMNRYHFIRCFREAFGDSPYGYLTTMRIAQAKRLLAQTRLGAGEIAAQCGFFSASRFSSAFHKHTGYSPSQYRSQAVEGIDFPENDPRP